MWMALLLLLTASATAPAQVFDIEKDGVGVMTLGGPWRFHTGDDPRWAQPSFDDSGWSLLRSDELWRFQGYSDYAGVAWYRFRIRIPAGMEEPALLLPKFVCSYQAYADGRLIGALGGMPPHPRSVWAPYQLLRLPGGASGSGRDVVVAIRTWTWIQGYGGPTGTAQAGSMAALRQQTAFLGFRTFWEDAGVSTVALVYVMGGLASLLLFALRRSEREYLWFGVYELGGAFQLVIDRVPDFRATWSPGNYILSCLGFTVSSFGFILFLATLLRMGKPRALQVAAAGVIFASLVFCCFPILDYAVPGGFPPSKFGTLEVLNDLGQLTFNLGLLFAVFQAMRRRVSDAHLLFYPMLLNGGTAMVEIASFALTNFGFRGLASRIDRFYQLTDWPFPIGLVHVTEFLTQGAILAILVHRYARSRKDEERMSSELEAARLVQQVLVPAAAPSISGYTIETSFKPDGQVSGDFFQIIPTSSGGALIAIGDESGKGMPAAMTVSLLVGTLRTLAHYTQSPGEILMAMNQHLLLRNRDGFTTCLILRVDADGTFTAANAGHLAPYCDGKELSLENGLPLGLLSGASYPETRFELPANAQLTLVTDGVVEARASDGQLFGFERLTALSRQSAGSIADAATAFGQQDDVTVLTLSRPAVAIGA
jgi:hypothetical protein